jgi:hypothetical protein
MPREKKEPRPDKTPDEIREEKERIERLEKAGWTRPRQASGGEITEWKKGLIVIGELAKFKKLPGPDSGTLVEIRHTKDDPNVEAGTIKVYGCPTLLLQTIENVPIGTELYIECRGQVIETNRGQKAWDFYVAARGQGDLGL